jgi:hypothetical protein
MRPRGFAREGSEMIYTRFGSQILSIEWFDEESGDVGCVVNTEGDNPHARVFHAAELKADDGIKEIVGAAKTIRNAK